MAKKYLKRCVDDELSAWKNENGRKVLLVRGARQVGKSSSVVHLGGSFEHFLMVNFERDRKAHALFDGDFDVRDICEKLSILFKTPVVPGKTLLFFDEIQSCPNAISALRFFYEDYPELHVIAAGSLLEFALEELPSFGVGRIRSIFMHPLSYREFLWACGESALWDEVCESSPKKPLFEPFHEKCLEYLKKFLIIGGMPAVVADYVENGRLLNAQKILNDLIISLKSDFSKYKKRVSELRISAAFNAAVNQSGGRFNYAKVEQLNYRQIKESLRLLQNAGLLIPVVHSSANALPLGGGANFKKQKFLLLDTGIFQRILGLELSDVLLNNDISLVNKGAIAEQFAGLELLKSSSYYSPDDLYFWSREKSQSNAEIDYVVQRKENIVPIEIKSGSTGKMQSMFVFLNEKKTEYGVRVSLENFAAYDRIKVYPLYAVGVI
ncbi:MAG: ATP-binding protein [Chitinispirillales bacterium]|jgi:predicted AAA+ superfamily ATPase|nr:ATP-binding protein [Chitinispirillales bacterium]